MEFECDYDTFGDTRNRKGKIEQGYNSHNKGFKEQQRIYYIKQKRLMQSLADKGMEEDESNEQEIIDNSKKRKLKHTVEEDDKEYGNNYTPVENKKKKKKNSKKDRVRF